MHPTLGDKFLPCLLGPRTQRTREICLLVSDLQAWEVHDQVPRQRMVPQGLQARRTSVQKIPLPTGLRWMLGQYRPMMIMTVMAEPFLTQCRNFGSRAVAQERSRHEALAAELQKAKTLVPQSAEVSRMGNTTAMNM